MNPDIAALNEKIKQASGFVDQLLEQVGRVIVGQKAMLERILIAILSDGHVLLEGVPGLAKTLTVKCFADAIQAEFRRIQITPDLLPADLIGTLVFNQKTGEFTPKKGPLFTNLILADEINRAPAKVQSALLEAMQERQVTIGDTTHKLDAPFLVMATQNPIEQEGTYPLPEAQVDRFMLKLKVIYPTKEEELEILRRMARTSVNIPVNRIVTTENILRARSIVDQVYMDEKIQKYIVDIVEATREPEKHNLADMKLLIQYGASPRATISLAVASKAYAFLQRRGYVTPQDVKTIGMDVLRHRVIPSYEAEAESKTSEDIVKRIFEEVQVP